MPEAIGRRTIPIPLQGGKREDSADTTPDGFLTLQNLSRRKRDSYKRRRAMGNPIRVAKKVLAMAAHSISGTRKLIIEASDGHIYSVALSQSESPSLTDEGTVNTAGAYGMFASLNDDLFFADGGTPKALDALGTYGNIGITTPADMGTPTVGTSAPGMSVGEHIFRYRYRIENDDGGADISDPSAYVRATIASGEGATFSIGANASGEDIEKSADTRVDHIVIEVGPANGTEWLGYTSLSNSTSETSLTIAFPDNVLYHTDTTFADYDPNLESVGNGAPPVLSTIVEHRGRLFGTKGKWLYFSGYGKPMGWSTALQARSVFNDSSDTPTGMASVFGDLYIMGKYSMQRFAYIDTPEFGFLETLPTQEGLWNPRCLVRVRGVLYGFGPNGIWKLAAMLPENISDPVRTTVETGIDRTAFAKFHGVYDPEDEVILWFYVPTGESECSGCLVWDLRELEWRTNDYRQGITASLSTFDNSGNSIVLLATENNDVWFLTNDLKGDGVSDGATHSFTCTNSGSVTTITTVSTLGTDPSVAGVFLMRASTLEVKRITSNTANGVTIASAFSTALVLGEEFWIGPIEMVIQPKRIKADRGGGESSMPGFKINVKRLMMQQIPDSTANGKWYCYLYDDFDSTAKSWTIGASDTPPNGQGITDGYSYCTLDIDQPFVGAGVNADFAREVTIKLVQLDPDCDPEITGLWVKAVVMDQEDE